MVLSGSILSQSSAVAAGIIHVHNATSGNWSAAGDWSNGVPNAAGDVANYNGTVTTTVTPLLDQAVTIGQVTKTGNKNWTITADADPLHVFTLDNTAVGSLPNAFDGTLAAITTSGTGGTLTINPGVVIGAGNTGIVIGAIPSTSTAPGAITLTGGITGTGDVYAAGRGNNTSAITISTTAVNNTGNLILGKSDADTVETGTGAITISGGVGTNVKTITAASSGSMSFGTAGTNPIVNSGNITISAAGVSNTTAFAGFVNNAGTITNNSVSTGAVSFTGGIGSAVTSITHNAAGTMTLSSPITVNSGGTSIVANFNTGSTSKITVSGAFNGTGDLTLANNGSVANAITLTTGGNINNVGNLYLSGNGSGGITLGVAVLVGSGVTNVTFNGAGPLTVTSTTGWQNNGDITFSGTGSAAAAFSGAGAIFNNAGSITFNGTGSSTVSFSSPSASLNNSGTILNNGTTSGATSITAIIGSSVTGITQNSTTSRLELLGANTPFGGPINIQAGTLRLNTATALGGNGAANGTGGLLTISNGTFLDATATTVMTTNNAVTLNGNMGFVGTNSLTFGPGALALNAANITISNNGAGTLSIGAGGVTGNSTLTTTANAAGGITLSGLLSGVGTILNNGGGTGTATFSGGIGSGFPTITENSATSALTVSGLLTVNASGTTLINSNPSGTKLLTASGGVNGTGALVLQNNSNITAGITLSGATQVNNVGSITNNGTGTIANVAGTTIPGSGTTISSVIGTQVTSVVQNSATAGLTLSGANTFTYNGGSNLGLQIKAGTVRGDTSATAFGAGRITLGEAESSASAALIANGISITNPITVSAANAAATLTIGGSTAASGSTTFGGLITLAHDVVIRGLFTGNTTTFSGGFDGTGNITAIGQDGATGGTITVTGLANNAGQITLASGSVTPLNLNGGVGSSVTQVTQSNTSTGDLSIGAGGLTVNGTLTTLLNSSPIASGDLNLTGAVNGMGNLLINANAVGAIAISGVIGNTGSVTINQNSSGAVTDTVAINNSGPLTISGTGIVLTSLAGGVGSAVTSVGDSAAGAVTLGPVVANASGLTITSTTANSTGLLTLGAISGGNITLNANGAGSISAGAMTGGNIVLNANNSAGNITVASANNTGTITNSGSGTNTTTITGVIGTNITAGGVTQNSAGSVLVLNGANTFTTGLNILQGTVKLGSTTAAGAGLVTIGSLGNSAVLDLNGASRTIIQLATGGTPANQTIGNSGSTAATLNYTGANTTNFGGVIQNVLAAGNSTTALTLNNAAAILTLSGPNTYTGLTTVTAGTLKVGAAGAINSGNNLTTAAVGIFDLNGFSQTLTLLTNAGNVTNSGGSTRTLTIGNASTGAGTFTGLMNLIWNQGATGSSITGTTLGMTGDLTINANGVGAANFTTANHVGTITFSGVGNGTSTITTIGANVTRLDQNSNGAAPTVTTLNVNSAGTIVASNSTGALLTVSTVAGSGNLTLQANNTGSITVVAANHSGTITNSGSGGTNEVTISGIIGTNVTGVTQDSLSSSLLLKGVNTFTGTGLYIKAGTVTSGTSSAAFGPAGGTITLGQTGAANSTSNPASLYGNVTSANYAQAIVLGGGSNGVLTIGINNNSSTSTYSGGVTGPNSFSINATNIQTLTFNTNPINNAGTVTNASTGSAQVTISSVIGSDVTGVVQNTPNGSVLLLNAQNTFNNPGTGVGLTVKRGTVSTGLATTGSTSGPFGPDTQTVVLGDSAGSDATLLLTNSAANVSNPIRLGTNAVGTLTLIYNSTSTAPGGTFSGPIDLNGMTATLSETSTGQLNVNGAINGAGTVVVTAGNGLVSLTGNSGFGGGVTVKSGTLLVSGSATALGGGTLTLGDSAAANTPATLRAASTSLAFANPIALAANNAGALTVGNSGTTQTPIFSGGVTGSNNLTLNATATGGSLTFATGILNNTGTITNSGTGASAVNISSGIGTLVSSVKQSSATSALNLTGGANSAGAPISINAGTFGVTGDSTIGTSGTPTVTVGGSGTLSLVGGTINTLNLNWSAGSGEALLFSVGSTLKLEASGDTADTIVLGSGLSTNVGAGSITLNVGVLNSLTTASKIILINSPGGGIDYTKFNLTGAFGGNLLTLSDSGDGKLLYLNVTAENGIYWTGVNDNNWSTVTGGPLSNFADDSTGGSNSGVLPTSDKTVHFYATSANLGNLATTLGGTNYTIAGLTVDSAATTAVSIAADASEALTITAITSNGGILVNSGAGNAAGALTISAPVILGANQSWTNASDNAMTITGAVNGEGNLIVKNTGGANGVTNITNINSTGSITNSGSGTGTTTISGTIGSNVTGITQNSLNSGLTLSGATSNTYTGAANVVAGLLRLSKTSGIAIPGDLNIQGSGTSGTGLTFGVSSNTDQIADTATVTVNGGFLNGSSMNVGTAPSNETIGTLTVTPVGANNAAVVQMSTSGGNLNVAGTMTVNGGAGGGTSPYAVVWGASNSHMTAHALVLNDMTSAINGNSPADPSLNKNAFYVYGNSTAGPSTFSIGTGGLTLNSNSVMSFRRSNTTSGKGSYLILDGDVTVGTGTSQIREDSGGGTIGGLGVNLSGLLTVGSTRTFNTAGNLAISIPLVNGNQTMGITKTGAGTLTLTDLPTLGTAGTSSYTGDTVLLQGILNTTTAAINGSNVAGAIVFNGGTLQAGTGGINTVKAVTMTGAGTFDTQATASIISGNVTGSGGALTKNGASSLTLSGAANTFSGGLIIASGSLIAGNPNPGVLGAGKVTMANSTTLDLNGNSPTTGLLSTSGSGTGVSVTSNAVGTPVLRVSGSSSETFAGVISNGSATSVGLIKAGSGTQVLSGNNTYTGPTTVSDSGSMLEISGINGRISGTTQVDVTSGGTLLLSGGNADRINTAPVSLDSGTLAFGSGIYGMSETLGSLSLSGNSTLDFGSTSTDATHAGNTFIFGGLAINSGATLSIYNWSGSAYGLGQPDNGTDITQDRLLFGAPGTGLDDTALSAISFYAGGAGSTLLGTGHEISFDGNFEIVPVPEPSSTALIGAAGLLGLVGYRERRGLGGLISRKSNASIR